MTARNVSGPEDPGTADNQDNTVMTALGILHEPGSVIELRVLNTGRTGTVSGYFEDHRTLAVSAAKWSGKAPAVYTTLNPVNPALLARASNRAAPYAKQTTSDRDIQRRRWLPLDFDPVRPSGIGSTDEQHEAAIERARDVRRWLKETGWPEPVAADSGNGAHLLFHIDLPNDDAARDLVKAAIEVVAEKFSDNVVEVDRTVYNAARIWKLYGTLACKGDDIPDRPHRPANLLYIPERIETVSRVQLKELAGAIAKPAPHHSPRRSGDRLDIEEFIRRHGLETKDPVQYEGGQKWVFPICPWNPDHTDNSAYLVEHASGAISAGCHHNGCASNDWRSMREKLEPGCYDRREQRPNEPPATGGTARQSGQAQMQALPAGSQTDALPHGSGEPEVKIQCAADITPEVILWLWYEWLAAGKLHILAGAPGTGKTTLALAMAAAMSTGGRWPDGTKAPMGDVLIWSGEDDPRDTLVPRLMACGADRSRVHIISGVVDDKGPRPFNPASDAILLQEAARKLSTPVRLLIVDPVVSAVAGDSHKNAEVRRALQPLVDFGQSHRAAILGISHFTKGSAGKDPVDRVTGSLAFGALARIVLGTAKLQNDDQRQATRVLARAKSNIGPDTGGFEYSLEQVAVPGVDGVTNTRVTWGSAVEGTARELLGQAEAVTDPEEHSDQDQAVDWLCDLLKDHPMAATDVRKLAELANFTWRTMQRARKRAGVTSKRQGYGKGAKYIWAIRNKSMDAMEPEQDEVAHMAHMDDSGGGIYREEF